MFTMWKIHNYIFVVGLYCITVTKTQDLPPPPSADYQQCQQLTDDSKFDCYPEDDANQQLCESRGCCWIPSGSSTGGPLNVPACFYPPSYGTYNYLNVTQYEHGYVAYLKRDYGSSYPEDIEIILLNVTYETEYRLHVKISDPLNQRWESPYPEITPLVYKKRATADYSFRFNASEPGFSVIRTSDNNTIFDTKIVNNFIFANQFIQLSSKLPSNYIYGIGEHTSSLLLSTNWNRFTLFNHDRIPDFNNNLYGSQPFYLVVEESGTSHGVFLKNSNAMDIILQPSAITFRTIGGILDFYFFLGPTPADVVSQYTELVGRPFLVPLWALGFQLCKFGYASVNETRDTTQRNIDAGIPLDVQWNDIDYTVNDNMFTLNDGPYKGLPDFVQELHDMGMHYIPIIDPALSGSEPPGTYPPYDIAVDMDVLVKDASGDIFRGLVWNSDSTVWVDYTHPNASDYWTLMFRNFHELVPIDGAWIDMNDPSNFLSGSFDGCPDESPLENPPYRPAVDGGSLYFKTICMTAQHYASTHYDVHNLYGIFESDLTNRAMTEVRGKRPMVITRSTFAGNGRYAGHWSGDVVSQWLDMRMSIPQLLSFSIFGVPLMGADICGFNGDTTIPLCSRWQQLGAFYPFSRNHNMNGNILQDPAILGDEVIIPTRKALRIRYSLLPYLYTLFYKAHLTGETVARPLFFEFINDTNTYNIDTQFLWGPALMIVPALEEDITEVSAYLPEGLWYDYYDRTVIQHEDSTVVLPAPWDTIPVLLRGGFIIPQQAPEQTTTKTRLNKFELLVISDTDGSAVGDLYWDDGDSLDSAESKHFSVILFNAVRGRLSSNTLQWGYDNVPNLGLVTVLGVEDNVSEVTVNDSSQSFTYDSANKVLVVDGLDISLENTFEINWS